MSQPPNDLELVLPDGWRSHPTAPLMVTKGADDRLGALQLSSGAVHAGIPLSGQAADMGTQAKLGVPAERWDGPCAYGLMGEVHLVSKEHADVHLGLACCEGAEPVLFTWISAVVGLWPEVLSIVKSMRVRSGSLGAEAAWLVGSTRSSFEEDEGNDNRGAS